MVLHFRQLQWRHIVAEVRWHTPSGEPCPGWWRLRKLYERHQSYGIEEFGEAVEALVEGDAALQAELAGLCAKAPDYAKYALDLRDLIMVVGEVSADIENAPEGLEAARESLSDDMRHMLVVVEFILQVENGGVHQYFYNPSGDEAPELLEALLAMDLLREAAVVGEALAHFKGPYIRDTELRRARHFHGRDWNQWDEKLNAFPIDDGARLHWALVDYARRHRVLAPWQRVRE